MMKFCLGLVTHLLYDSLGSLYTWNDTSQEAGLNYFNAELCETCHSPKEDERLCIPLSPNSNVKIFYLLTGHMIN